MKFASTRVEKGNLFKPTEWELDEQQCLSQLSKNKVIYDNKRGKQLLVSWRKKDHWFILYALT